MAFVFGNYDESWDTAGASEPNATVVENAATEYEMMDINPSLVARVRRVVESQRFKTREDDDSTNLSARVQHLGGFLLKCVGDQKIDPLGCDFVKSDNPSGFTSKETFKMDELTKAHMMSSCFFLKIEELCETL